MYTTAPATTRVAECSSALTGVGPSIASGSHEYVSSRILLVKHPTAILVSRYDVELPFTVTVTCTVTVTVTRKMTSDDLLYAVAYNDPLTTAGLSVQ